VTKPILVILAAGIASRYGGLKQVESVGPGGEMIIDYSIFDAIRVGFERIIFVIRRDIEEDFKRAVSNRFDRRISVAYAYQEIADLPLTFKAPSRRTKPWGTGQAILLTESLVSGPFAVINADDFYGYSAFHILFDFLNAADSGIREYALVGYKLSQTLSEHGSVSRGVCDVNADRMLRKVREIRKIEPADGGGRYVDDHGVVQTLSGETIVSMNMWAFTPPIFGELRSLFIEFLNEHLSSEQDEFLIPTAVGALVDRGARVRVLPNSAKWFGITYQMDKELVAKSISASIANDEYPSRLWS
jgi:NDP-sugar pyrophosphorylase family protein